MITVAVITALTVKVMAAIMTVISDSKINIDERVYNTVDSLEESRLNC